MNMGDWFVVSFIVLQVIASGCYVYQGQWSQAVLWTAIAVTNSAILWMSTHAVH